jgi:hypothetical protein
MEFSYYGTPIDETGLTEKINYDPFSEKYTLFKDGMELPARTVVEFLPNGEKNAERVSDMILEETSYSVDSSYSYIITFLHKQCDYDNSIGIFSYPTDSPPESLENVIDAKIIFPSCKNLIPGDSVMIPFGGDVSIDESGTLNTRLKMHR